MVRTTLTKKQREQINNSDHQEKDNLFKHKPKYPYQKGRFVQLKDRIDDNGNKLSKQELSQLPNNPDNTVKKGILSTIPERTNKQTYIIKGKEVEKSVGGRPRGSWKFHPDQLKQIELLSLLGASNEQIALFFSVSVDTVEYWAEHRADYQAARKRGGMDADMKVAGTLLKRALGYSYIETEYTAITDPMTGEKMPLEKMALVKKTKKVIPPDIKAITTWLKTKQREIWAFDPTFIHKHEGSIEHKHKVLKDIPIEELSEDAKRVVFEIATKQIAQQSRDN